MTSFGLPVWSTKSRITFSNTLWFRKHQINLLLCSWENVSNIVCSNKCILKCVWNALRLTVCAQFSDLLNVKQGGDQKGSVKLLAQKGTLHGRWSHILCLAALWNLFANCPAHISAPDWKLKPVLKVWLQKRSYAFAQLQMKSFN